MNEPNNNNDEDWRDYKRLVLNEIKYQRQRLESLDHKVDEIKAELHAKLSEISADLVMLKTKATIWGGGIGALVAAVVSALVAAIIANQG